MAQITASAEEKIFTIKNFLGLNENPNGDTELKFGEASVCDNFKITRDNKLQRRYGTETVFTLSDAEVKGLWRGIVNGYSRMLAACNGKLYSLYNGTAFELSELGNVSTSGTVSIFGFGGNAYILTGSEYKVFDGTALNDVDGYSPIVLTAASPDGDGTILEQVNKLNGKRRVHFSPDGTSTVFRLPESGLTSIDSVTSLVDGSSIPCTKDTAAGTVTFSTAPAEGVNTIEIVYTYPTSAALSVKAMRYAELYNGSTDTRVWLYGDGSNKAFYSGLDENGTPRADYFPDMNEMAVGESNTPITGMIRHYSQLSVFKPDSAWTVYYYTQALADGATIASFNVKAINKNLGNSAPGQVHLVLNSPRTIHGKDVYEWRNSSSYSANLTIDERQARRISDRISSTLSTFDPATTVCYDDNDNQEYYICNGTNALIHNYAADAWYTYSSFDARCLCSLNGELYFGSSDGKVRRLSKTALNDGDEKITARWESGNISFNQGYRRKFSSLLWVTLKPEAHSEMDVTVETDRKTDNAAKNASAATLDFSTLTFPEWRFDITAAPKSIRLKIKAKKFVYWKLIFSSDKKDTTATVLNASMKVRFTGYAK